MFKYIFKTMKLFKLYTVKTTSFRHMLFLINKTSGFLKTEHYAIKFDPVGLTFYLQTEPNSLGSDRN